MRGEAHNRGSCSGTACPSNEDSEATQAQPRSHSRVHHHQWQQASRDGSGHFHHARIVLVVGGCRGIPTNRRALDAFSPHKYERASSKHLRGGALSTNHTPSLREPTPAAEPFAAMAKSGGDCAASSIAAAIEFVA